VATVVLADPRLTPSRAVPAALVGGLAGGIDVALRAVGTPYAPLLAVTIALAVTTPLQSTSPGVAGDEATEALAAGAPAPSQTDRGGDGPG
jgi:hypothetical protein